MMDQAHDALAAVFARWALRERAPGVAWGLLHDGVLAGTGGIGTLRIGEDATPDANSVFRIASMTKSFTGAALLSLVVEGRVRLDEPVATYVPELIDWRGPTSDGPPLTVRHLVSMESGLPTDDPWADRHMDLSPAGMDELISSGASFAWTPGVRFEYSNLGWGLVGRVIERVAGVSAQDLVSRRLLAPLKMHATTWTRPADDAAIAEPYRWEDDAWRHEGPTIGDGTIAPMGGLWTSVADLARWVSFFCDAWPPRDDPDDAPLPRWARREMQRFRSFDVIETRRPRPNGPSRTVAMGYGIGLGVRVDERLGVVVGHSGGLPGYGSHMRWIPDRGVGVVALSNVTYGDMHGACVEALDVLADLDALPPSRALAAAPALAQAATRAVELVNDWQQEIAGALFADNIDPDEALDRREAEARAVVARHGPLSMDSLDVDAPMRGDVIAAGGRVKIELELNHENKVQWWKLADRDRPSDAPIVADPAALAEAPRTAYVVLRPTGDLADAFQRWQGEALDRLSATVATVVPAAHASLKAFGSTDVPIEVDDEARIAAVVQAWAAATGPIELRAEALDVFEGDEQVPIVRLAATGPFRLALADLWRRCAEAALPVGYSDHVGSDAWIPHLSLAYPLAPDVAAWDAVRSWARHGDTANVASVASEAEVVVIGDGAERRLGRYPFKR